MTQIWPGFGEGPVPTTVSMICKPEGVVMGFPVVWACAIDGASERNAPATPMATARASGRFRYRKCLIFSILCASIAERAAVLAGIGAAGQRTLFPIDPDRLAATERSHHAGGLVPDLLQAFDNRCGHAILELIDVFVMKP